MKNALQLRVLPLLVLALVTLAGSIEAQTTLGRIVGTVRDQTGAVVPGAKIAVTNELTGQVIQTVTASSDGTFLVTQVSAGSYSVKIEASNFKTASYTEVKVDAGRDYSLDATLEVGQTNELVQVTAGADLVNTSSPEITNTVMRRQIVDLPLNGRNPIELIRLQAGVVGLPTRTNTTINGGRPTWSQLTQDGINIQDNFIRGNALDFVPNRPTSDTIGEFTITTNTQGADSAGGASQVKLVTPSGENEFHGTLYAFNRNSAFGANSWFNNNTIDRNTGKTIPRSFLNRNQFGGNIGGPVLASKKVFGPLGGWNDNKDKLFFFFTYEGFRQRQQATKNNVIPTNEQLVDGAFRYVRTSDQSVQQVNVLSLLPGLVLDPAVRSQLLAGMPSSSLVNNFDVGNSSATRLLNTAGYRFLQSDFNDRNQYGFRFDFHPTQNHSFEFIHNRFKETDDRTDLDAINQRPKVFTDSDVKFFVGAWRWTATPKLQNELRIGANLAPADFVSIEDYSGLAYTLPLALTLREVSFLPQGRNTRTRQYIDNASYSTGSHNFQFGGSLQQIRVRPYDFFGLYPTLNFGYSAQAPAAIQLTAANFPGGISAADLASANSLRTFLGGLYSSTSQTFQVASKTSGYVPGIPNARDFVFDNWAGYAQDNWRIRPNLTLRLGLKWEYFSPLKDENDLFLLPVNQGSTQESLLNPNGVVDFVNGGFYDKDLNNFGPSVGIAWDPFKDGKTSIRAGYTMAFVNEETITVGQNAVVGNAGLTTTVTNTNLLGFFRNGLPPIATPAFKVPRTYADQIGLALNSAAFGIDQKIKQPFVHQISFAIEREIWKDIAIEARYIATLGRDIWRGVDLNQIDPLKNQPFLDDFKRAQSNGYLALAASGAFNPAFNANIAGSQPLSVLTTPTFGGGFLTDATVRSLIQTGQVGSLADIYMTGVNQAIGANVRNYFFSGGGNPGIYAADIVLNGGKTDYHALQLEGRRRFSGGIFAQVNYTFSKVLTNSPGTTQARFEPYIDNNRQDLERTRADFDVTQVFHGSVIYELPFGSGKRWLSAGGVSDKILGGWQLSSIIHAQSGAPISLLSTRGTFNRTGRSTRNPIDSSLTPDAIKDLFGIKKLPDGRVYYIDPAVIDSSGRGVGPDVAGNVASFNGQVFFNPNAGTIGSQQRLQFDGPSQTSWDFSVIKRTRLTESQNLEFRAEFFNFLNHPLFFVGDQAVNSTTFGRISLLNFGPRVVQFALKYNF